MEIKTWIDIEIFAPCEGQRDFCQYSYSQVVQQLGALGAESIAHDVSPGKDSETFGLCEEYILPLRPGVRVYVEHSMSQSLVSLNVTEVSGKSKLARHPGTESLIKISQETVAAAVAA